jgi:hypothetical protein
MVGTQRISAVTGTVGRMSVGAVLDTNVLVSGLIGDHSMS